MKKIVIGGVPEHFNLPWHDCIESGIFGGIGLQVEWKDFPGGTGAMIQALENNELDLALLLTEGAITSIENGSNHQIVGQYVSSPLNWGIHINPSLNINGEEQINEEFTFAISRYGSGSHLMALVYGIQKHWDLSKIKFKVVNNLTGAIESLASDIPQVFLWEKITTQPYVTKGDFKRVGVLPTPWPCFVLSRRNEASISEEESEKLLEMVLTQARVLKLNELDSIERIIQKYKLERKGVEEWFSEVKWSSEGVLLPETIDLVKTYLSQAGKI